MKTTDCERPETEHNAALAGQLADNAFGAQPDASNRKTASFKMKWLVTSVALVTIAGGYLGLGEYLSTQKKLRTEVRFSVALDCLAQDQKLNTILKRMETGDVAGAVDRLNVLLSRDIVNINAQIASADDRVRSAVETAFARMGQFQPKPPQDTAGVANRARSREEIEAKKILALAVGTGGERPAP